MSSERIQLQPTLRRLLELAALSEAEVLSGREFLDRQISQVVAALYGGQRTGTLALIREDALDGQDLLPLQGMSGLILVSPVQAVRAVGGKSAALKSQVLSTVELQPVIKLCSEAATPLILLPCLGDVQDVIEEVRAAYLGEVKKANARLHAHFVRLVVEEGLAGFVERLSDELSRPAAVETADFKIVAAQNMGPTPASQQKTLSEQVAELLKKETKAADQLEPLVDAVRAGRRLVAPIVLEGAVLGYFSLMLRPSDDEELMSEYLRPAVLAALVDFGHRRRDFAISTVTHRSLLRDLLQGHTLAASDQDRLGQFFGLDICDGSLVFALRFSPANRVSELSWNEERQIMVEMEGAYVFVVPVEKKQGLKWQDCAESLASSLKQKLDGLKIQMGASRLAPTLLDLTEAYREARQALVTGSMMHGESEFTMGYGELGVKRILYLMFDHPELGRFYEEHLSPLAAYDAEWETELVDTLRVYLAQGYNLNSAAKELFIHRHTMRYRLEQIADLLKVDIDSPEVLLNLQIAFLIREMKGTAKP
jgi:hypothetical protein